MALIAYMVGHSPKAGAVGYTDSDGQSVDIVFDLLADQRRRYVLACLVDNTQSMALADLAEDVAVRENEGTLTAIPKEEVQAISTSLYHIHIPKLVDEGVIEYNDRDLIQISEITDLIERVLSLDADGEKER